MTATQLIPEAVRAAYQAQTLADQATGYLTAAANAGATSPASATSDALVGVGFALLALRMQLQACTHDLSDAAAYLVEQASGVVAGVVDALQAAEEVSA